MCSPARPWGSSSRPTLFINEQNYGNPEGGVLGIDCDFTPGGTVIV